MFRLLSPKVNGEWVSGRVRLEKECYLSGIYLQMHFLLLRSEVSTILGCRCLQNTYRWQAIASREHGKLVLVNTTTAVANTATALSWEKCLAPVNI